VKAPRDIVDFMIKLFREKYRTVCAKVAEQKKRGFLDVPLLKHYSRLLKMREWVESELGMRYLSLGNGRIILAEKLGIRDCDRVLDVGSGDGWFSIQAALRHPGATFYGVELSEEFAEATEYAEIFGVKKCVFLLF